MSRLRRIPAQTDSLRIDAIRPDMPLRLDVAAGLAYPDGSMTASGLRREAKRGRLVIERTAGKDYTTLGHINRMREQCRLETKAPASIFDPHAATMAASRGRRTGSSGTEPTNKARAALHMMLKEPSAPSTSTSRTSTQKPRVKLAPVIPIGSRSPTS
jgi:hypothetical protein